MLTGRLPIVQLVLFTRVCVSLKKLNDRLVIVSNSITSLDICCAKALVNPIGIPDRLN